MAVNHVGVHEVCIAQAVEVAVHPGDGLVDAIGVVDRQDVVGGSTAGKQVEDLANRQHVEALLLEAVEHGRAGGFQRKVVATRSACVGPLPLKRARDHAAHAMLALQLCAGDAAVLVELLRRHHALVRRDLEDAVGRGVDDERAGLHLLAAVVTDDIGARVGQVADDLAARSLLEGLQDLRRETLGVGGQRSWRDDAGHLPVPHGAVFALALLLHAGKGARGCVDGCQRVVVHRLERAFDVEQAQLGEVGDAKVRAGRASAQRVGALVSPLRRVGLLANAKAVQNDDKDALVHGCRLPVANGLVDDTARGHDGTFDVPFNA